MIGIVFADGKGTCGAGRARGIGASVSSCPAARRARESGRQEKSRARREIFPSLGVILRNGEARSLNDGVPSPAVRVRRRKIGVILSKAREIFPEAQARHPEIREISNNVREKSYSRRVRGVSVQSGWPLARRMR
jgi:hypothetical protein